MIDLKPIETRVSEIEHGFTEIRNEASSIVKKSGVSQSLQAAKQLYSSEKYQARMVAVFVLGYVSARSAEALRLLRTRVSKDESWRVQEILAQAFNEHCKSVGYEEALPVIRDWLRDGSPNVRRAVTEGLRVWNQRDYFRENPQVAIRLLSELKDDESEYVRRSVGNALRDISRNEKELVRGELATWDTSDPKVRLTHRLASKFL